jgi:pimeloyl-ACP methyl ester carboxylesterase
VTVTVGRARLAYETVGTGRPLLCIHGYAIDRRMMKACMEPVFAGRSGQDWQRIYVDMPGMGESTAPLEDASSDRIHEALQGFLDAVVPGQRVALAAESYGCYHARAIVKKRAADVDGVLLLCPMIIPDRDKRERPGFRLMARDEEFCRTLPARERARFEADMVVQTRQTWQRYSAEILPGLAAGSEEFKRVLHGSAYPMSFDVDSLDAPFEGPALFLLGRQDDVVGWRDAVKIVHNYPRAAIAVLDRAGHNLQVEQARLFEALAGEWLDRVEEAAAGDPGGAGEAEQ